jgi:hypothetical protein
VEDVPHPIHKLTEGNTMTEQTVTDVVAKDEQAAEQPQPASLRSIHQNNIFHVGISPKASLEENGNFQLTSYLSYSDLDEALKDIDAVRTHLMHVRERVAFERGIAEATKTSDDSAETPTGEA